MWTARDVRRTYGLDDETAKDIDSGKKEDITKIVIEIFDKNGDGMVSREEWMNGWVKEGKRLPDFGVGLVAVFSDVRVLVRSRRQCQKLHIKSLGLLDPLNVLFSPLG